MRKNNLLVKVLLFSLIIFFFNSLIGSAQPSEQWNKTFGGTKYDYAESVQQTKDGGYILAGYTRGLNDENAWLIKTDASGNEIWNKTFGKGMVESVQQTSDDGYIIAGSTYPADGSWDHRNAWLIKTDTSGNEIWNKTFGVGVVESVQQTSDDGYILAGYKDSFVAQFIKTDASGNELWNKIFSVTMADYAHSVQQTSDGGYILAGMSSGNALLIKIDASGNQQWYKTFSVTMGDIAQSVQQTSDGGYIFTGYGYSNVFLIKTDTSGNQQWSKIFGGKTGDFGYSVKQTKDGGYILAGQTTSNGAGGNDAWLIRTDSNGNKFWDKTFGGTGDDYTHSVQKTSDGGYILAGSTTSYGTGTPDAWLIKVSSEISTPTLITTSVPTTISSPNTISSPTIPSPLKDGKETPQLMGVILILVGLLSTALTAIKKDTIIEVRITERSLKYIGGAGIMLIIIGAYILLKSFGFL
jgi:hypothetical protein